MMKRPFLITAAVLLVLLVSGNAAALYLDWLWFTELAQLAVFATILKTELLLGAAAAAVFFALVFGNLAIANRYRQQGPVRVLGDWTETPFGPIEPLLRRLLPSAVAAVALFVGLGTAGRWRDLLLFQNPTVFGRTDDVFGLDFGHYVFRLPFLSALQGWITGVLFVTLAATVFVYILHRGILTTPQGLFVDRLPRRHLLLLGAALLFAKAWGYRLHAYELLFTTRGLVTGALYADVNARIPALTLLVFLAAAGGVLLIAAAYLRGWRLPISVVAVVFVGSLVGVSIIPDLVHRFKVQPNEIVLETPYLKRNIALTRYAFGLNNVEEKEFPATEDLSAADLQDNALTLNNIRLWDQAPLLTTYRQLQQIRTYYDFVDVDNDRYVLDGQYRQVMISPRELSYRNLPGGANWINEHLTYTHGYGVIVGPVNRISPEGLPEFFIKDIPPTSTVTTQARPDSRRLQVTRPEIYYGESGNDYVFVRTQALEFDYPMGDRNEYATYAGRGGIPVGSMLRKLVFALQFGDLKILLSNDIQNDSRIMFRRSIGERVQTLAPFLSFDRDPYLVIRADGRLAWILDGYTTTDRIPYSQRLRGVGNYIRNAAKAVVDAYDGSVVFYISDSDDPLIQTYAKIFPTLFRPKGEIPEDLRAHLRYPGDLFNLQARLYATYHMDDPQIFYNREDLWAIPQKDQREMEPYYTIMRLPGETREEFILMIPYTPARRDNMAAWLAARSDGDHYGKLIVFLFPKQKLVYGPRQIEARIDQDAEISQQLTLWSQRGSQVIRGSLLVIPIETSLLYVEPLYLSAEAGSLPELRRVIVAYGNQIAMQPTLEASLAAIFGGPGTAPPARTTPATTAPPAAPGAAPPAADLARQALDHFERARQALRNGDFAGYGAEINRAEEILRQLTRPTR